MGKFRAIGHGKTGNWWMVQERVLGLFWVCRGRFFDSFNQAEEAAANMRNSTHAKEDLT